MTIAEESTTAILQSKPKKKKKIKEHVGERFNLSGDKSNEILMLLND